MPIQLQFSHVMYSLSKLKNFVDQVNTHITFVAEEVNCARKAANYFCEFAPEECLASR